MWKEYDYVENLPYPQEATRAYLPKWPAMVVYGEKIEDPDLVDEIQIRTNSLSLSCNARKLCEEWSQDIFGIPGPWVSDDYVTHWEALDKLYDQVHSLAPHLEFLTNERIVSSYIGGPKGWIDWDGNVGCSGYNIGKRPSATKVYQEWSFIASEFPQLDLVCFLFDKESGEEGARPSIEYRVKKGEVSVNLDIKISDVSPMKTRNVVQEMKTLFTTPSEHREVGVTKERLQSAWSKTLKKFEPAEQEDIHTRFVDLEIQ